MTAQERTEVESMLAITKGIAVELMNQLHKPTMPKRLALMIASIGDESALGYENKIIELYSAAVELRGERQRRSARCRQEECRARWDRLLNKNRHLMAHHTKSGWNVSRIAEKIKKEWEGIPVGKHVVGEPPSLTKRGDDDHRPSIRTIHRRVTAGLRAAII